MTCAYKKSISACDRINEKDISSLVNRHCIHVTPSVPLSYCIHIPLCFLGHSIFFRFILFIFIPTIRGSIYDGPWRRQRRHRVVVLSVPFRCVWFCSSYFCSSRVVARKIDIIIPDVPLTSYV